MASLHFLPLIDLSPYPAGTYLAHVETQAGISDVKFVKTE